MNLIPKETIEEWGLSKLTPEKQEEMVERIGRLLYQAVLVQSLDILSDKEQEELDEVLNKDTTTPDDVIAFLRSKIPTFDALAMEERQKLKEDILIPA
jgi:hypothetical protein